METIAARRVGDMSDVSEEPALDETVAAATVAEIIVPGLVSALQCDLGTLVDAAIPGTEEEEEAELVAAAAAAAAERIADGVGGASCCMCGGDSRYRCPGCGRRTCSLPCVKKHKHHFECDGKRKATEYAATRTQLDSNTLWHGEIATYLFATGSLMAT